MALDFKYYCILQYSKNEGNFIKNVVFRTSIGIEDFLLFLFGVRNLALSNNQKNDAIKKKRQNSGSLIRIPKNEIHTTYSPSFFLVKNCFTLKKIISAKKKCMLVSKIAIQKKNFQDIYLFNSNI